MRHHYDFSTYCFELGEQCVEEATIAASRGDKVYLNRLYKRADMMFTLANLFGFKYEWQEQAREDRYFEKEFPNEYSNH